VGDEDHGLVDLLKKCYICVQVEYGGQGEICKGLDLAGVECIESWIALQASTRPLRMQFGLRVTQRFDLLLSSKIVGRRFAGEDGCFTCGVKGWGPPARRLVGQIYDVALTKEEGGPALAIVRSVEPILQTKADLSAANRTYRTHP
jgi:hypothetical protein